MNGVLAQGAEVVLLEPLERSHLAGAADLKVWN